MLKVAIITIESFNFGNRLQNYALQYILENMGFQVETIRRHKILNRKEEIREKLIYLVQSIIQSKGAKFRDFDSLIHKSKYYAFANEAPSNLADEYDYFITGSDQVWNPYYEFVGSVDFLTFARPEQKISYAASFGVSELPIEKEEVYRKYLNDFACISVREEAGGQIIKKITGREVPVVIDPTLMLSADEWRKLKTKPSNMPKGKYILVYSVAGMSKEMKTEVEVASQNNTVLDIRKILPNGHEWAVGPSEFLYLIDEAEMFYTDSFHGTVFSILFHTNFKMFERDGIQMNSRIDTLLEKTGIKDGKSFEDVDKKIMELRQDSAKYLKEALSIEKL